jgi:ABC-type amino acid transport substrate-binding protein
MNMPSSFFVLAFAVLTLFPSTGFCLDKEKFKDGIVITASDKQAPMSFLGVNGEPKGFVIDYWKKWSQETGIRVRFQLTTWKETLELVKSGKCDVHGGLYRTPEREKYLDFTGPTFSGAGVLVVSRNSSIRGLDSIGDHVVGVMEKGSSQEILRTRHPYIKLKYYPSVEDAVEAFVAGEVDAVFADHHVIFYRFGKLGVDRNLLREIQIYEKALHVAVKKGNSELLAVINEGVSMIDKREMDTILNVWYVPDSSISMPLKLGLGFAVLLLLSGLLYLLIGGKHKVEQG